MFSDVPPKTQGFTLGYSLPPFQGSGDRTIFTG